MKWTLSSLGPFLRAHLRWVALAALAALTLAAVISAPRLQSPHAGALSPEATASTGANTDIAPADATSEFKTDFTKHSVPYTEILSGGPHKDGIPAIDAPKYVTVSEANEWIKPVEPVIAIQVGDDARAFPIQILIWHEIVNAEVGGTPLAVTFCPLCNTAIAYERTLGAQTLDFGTTGRLRFSNLVMYDRETESWWQQATGAAIVGSMTGAQLRARPASMISWADFKAAHPDGHVLSRDTGYSRSYGRNPYPGYDDIHSSPFLYQGPALPGTLPAMARILVVLVGDQAVAYPFSALASRHVINDRVGGEEVVVIWSPGTASPLDQERLAQGQDIGSASAFSRVVDGQRLTFGYENGRVTDRETGSVWGITGRATTGALASKSLTLLDGVNSFWFNWIAFRPDTRVYQA
jgi:hypothetical protein